MSEENLSNGVLQAQVRVDSMPAARQIVAVERQTDGTWRIAGSGASDENGLAELLIQAQYQSDIYALAIDEWGSKWEANMVVAVGELVRPTSFVGWLYRATQAGTLPAAEPEWWNSAAIGPQPSGTATLEAVRYYRPLVHGPLNVDFVDIPWAPENLATPAQVLLDDTSDVSELAGVISQWADRSGNEFHFSQGVSTKRPALLGAELNGRRVLRFDGVNDSLEVTSSAARAVFSNVGYGWKFAVYRRRSSGTNTCPLLQARTGSGSGRFASYCHPAGSGQSNSAALLLRRRDSDSSSVQRSSIAIGTNWTMTLSVAEWAVGRSKIYTNGGSAETATLPSSGVTDLTLSDTAIYLGSEGVTTFADIDVAAVFLGSGSLPTEAEIDKLFGWAAHRYGLQALLPAGHPYKETAPVL